jgi:nucleoside-diphosphate-sugar epimerase
MTVLVTGASGFIGKCVIADLLRRSIKVRVALRQGAQANFPLDNVEAIYLSGPGTAATNWSDAVDNCSAVIHLAARAHVLRDRNKDPMQAFRLANVDLTRACAEAAANARVKRFIFLSSVGVHGAISGAKPIQADSAIKPHTPYARSKAEAELALTKIVHGSDMELTVLRPPLVYGPGAPGNFGALVRTIARGWPIPLGEVTNNLRSFVAIDNLVGLIVVCLGHPAAANQTFLVSDGEDVSTADLLRRLGAAMGRPARLISVPVGWLALGARLFGKREIFQSLCGSLQVDIKKTCELLNWKPLVSMDEGLRRAASQSL